MEESKLTKKEIKGLIESGSFEDSINEAFYISTDAYVKARDYFNSKVTNPVELEEAIDQTKPFSHLNLADIELMKCMLRLEKRIKELEKS